MEIGEKTRVFYRVLPGKKGFKNRKLGFLREKTLFYGVLYRVFGGFKGKLGVF